MIKKNQEFMKPMDDINTAKPRLPRELLPFDSKYNPPRTPATPKNKLTRASA
jgi:hypothetical protein